jgi:DNA replication protein DnaC
MNLLNLFRIPTSEEKTITNERRSIMLTEQTLDKLYSMKLTGMAEAFKEQLQQPSSNPLSFEERFGFLVDRQWTWREEGRIKRLLEEAKLKLNACVEDIDYKSPRGIDRSLIMTLSSCDWIKKHHNVIITGPTGAGKTFLACALANHACRDGYRTFYIRAPKFYYQVALAKADGSYTKLMKKLLRTQLLLLDDFGLAPMADSERRELLEVIEDRHGHASTIMTSQLPVEHWHESIGDPNLADAILDRLIHNAHRINLKGGSMRKKLKVDSN